ncbi:nicotinamide riboside transporter PnuC [Hydrotalea sp.]|uniref:nicotinamide riboside transporter PnuC n=1 Tax=Hydrotalea sp. TaxID=2881279 RepID=UPI002621A538|nr:nicotinamide riboside transporter PnuC [Hydrotalea sp.]
MPSIIPYFVNVTEIWHQLLIGIQQTSFLEFTGTICGIASVFFSRKENILVYPVGMVSTMIYIYLYLVHGLYADASVNFYYTVMSVIGWVMWSRKKNHQTVLHISYNSKQEQWVSVAFFAVCWIVLYLVLHHFTDSTVPQADAFTSAAAFTGMYLMNKKKVENWWWWIITNVASIPLNFYKGLVFTSFQYLVLLILAIMGLRSWMAKTKQTHT